MKPNLLSIIRTICLFVLLLEQPIHTFAEPNQLILSTIKGSTIPPIKKIITEAYRRIGVEIILKSYPGQRALMQANDSITDGVLARISGLEKKFPSLVRVSVPVGAVEMVVFTKNVEFAVNGWDSLKPYKIVLVRGVKFAEKNTVGMKRSILSTHEQLFLMLNEGRADIAVSPYRIGQHHIKKLGITGIRALSPPIDVTFLYHYIHKRNAALIPKLTTVLGKMDKDGEIKKIWDSHN